MSEKYIQLNGFKYGLDGRKDILTSVPGTLEQLTNAHINAGGEIEQRLSFAKDATPFPTNTFGLQDTDSGLMTFGSDAAANAALPTGVHYQQLTLGSPFTSSAFAMSKVNYSNNFLGKAFVIATFSIIGTFAFYDGHLVESSRNGIVLPITNGGVPESNAQLAIELAAQINEMEGWLATPNVDQNGNARNGLVLVKTPSGVHLSPTFTTNSANGAVGDQLIDQNGDGVAAVAAIANFSVTGGSVVGLATFSLAAPLHSDGSGTAQLSGTVNWVTSNDATAAAIAAAVNANTLFYGYTAVSNTNNVTVYAPASFGDNVNGLNLAVTTTGDGTVGAGTIIGGFQISLNPANIDVLRVVALGQHGSQTVSGQITVRTSGATGAITYAWIETDANGNPLPVGETGSGIAMSKPAAASCGFSKSLAQNQAVIGHFKVTVHDAGTNTTKSQTFYVFLELDNLL